MKNTESRPFFSVIMASFNSEKYISDSINSVLNQTMSDWELLIIDDASKDNSLKIALKFANIDSRIRVFQNKVNSGPAFSRNRACLFAKGSWLAILDADDVYVPSKLETQKKEIENKKENIVLLGSGSQQITTNGTPHKIYRYPQSSLLLKKNLIKGFKFPPHSSIVYKASIFHRLKGFNENFLRANDYELFLRFLDKGVFSCCEAQLIKYRAHKKSISNSNCKNGFSQVNYALAAIISHEIRNLGLNDPSQNLKNLNNLLFFTKKILFKSEYIKINFIKRLFQSKNKINKVIKIFLLLKNFKICFLIIGQKYGVYSPFEKIYKNGVKKYLLCAEL